MNLQVKKTELPPFRPLPQKPPCLSVRKLSDGTVYIDSTEGPTHPSSGRRSDTDLRLRRQRAGQSVRLIAGHLESGTKPICAMSAPSVVANDSKIRDFVRDEFAAPIEQQSGSSTRAKRIILMAEPPSLGGHQITDKGYIHQRATMDRRRALVDKLLVSMPLSEVIEIP